MFRITRGLDIPIAGEPEQAVENGAAVTRVALLGDDFIGMKPTMEVAEGDRVQRGQLLFTDKKNIGVKFCSPGAGTVLEVNRGEKRKFLSIVIHLDGDEVVSHDISGGVPGSGETVTQQLNDAGLWPLFRARPFNRTPELGSKPHSIFVQAMDTSPLAGDPVPLIQEREDDFARGLQALSALTDGSIHVCKAPGKVVPTGNVDRVETHEFEGPHPAGLPGTHIHFIDPVGARGKFVWTIGAQGVIAIGEFYRTGQFPIERVVAVGGPAAKNPRLLRTRVGASLDELLGAEISDDLSVSPDAYRVVSGSVLSGHHATSPVTYLGWFDSQVSVLPEGNQRELIGWLLPGGDKPSVKGLYVGHWLAKKFRMTTNQNGSKRAMVPIGTYEEVMPMDILPTYLLRSLISRDTEMAQQLGCLELAEEDLGLCTYVCPGKYEYGGILRENLTTIEREG